MQAACLSLTACTSDTLLHRYEPLPAEGWERCDTICFDVPKQTEDLSGTLTIGLRTKANIGFQGVVLAVEQRDGTGLVSCCDTVRYPLTDADGEALTGGINVHQYETQYLPILLSKDKSTTVRIHHLMAREVISGITEVGIRIDVH